MSFSFERANKRARVAFPWTSLPLELQEIVIAKLDVPELGAFNVAVLQKPHDDDRIISILHYASKRGILTDVSMSTYGLLRRRKRPGSARLLALLEGNVVCRTWALSADMERPQGVKRDRSSYPTSEEVTKFEVWYGSAIRLADSTVVQLNAFFASELSDEFGRIAGFTDVFLRNAARNRPLVDHLLALLKKDDLDEPWKQAISNVANTAVSDFRSWVAISDCMSMIDAYAGPDQSPDLLSKLLEAAINRGSFKDADDLYSKGARAAVS